MVGKLLFNTSNAENLPFLANMPNWTINMSESSYCKCSTDDGDQCTMAQDSEQCPRQPGQAVLMQFDIAVRDARAPLQWVFGTFVADGQHKADEPNPWRRISVLGLMWGNDTPPEGVAAANYPEDPRTNGFADEVVFYDVADRLNVGSNAGHLGCNTRLNGPADNARSSCLSCHMTASVRDNSNTVPYLLADNNFAGGATGQCVPTADGKPNLTADDAYFNNILCATPFDRMGLAPAPQYGDGRTDWISLDYSLQLSISLQQWTEWQEDLAAPDALRRMTTHRRSR